MANFNRNEIVSVYPGMEYAGAASPQAGIVPMVVEETAHGERSFDVYSRLLKSNIIMLTGPIDENLAAVVKAQMLFLGDADKKNPVKLYIESGGGSITAGLGILDVMQSIPNEIITICSGQCASMAAVLLSQGDKRLIYPNARVLIHQPLMNGLGGQATDITIHANEINRMKDLLYKLMAKKSGQTEERIRQDCERDYILDAEAAIKYGLVDGYVPSLKKLGGAQ